MIWVSAAVLFVTPLTFLRNLDSLKYTSSLALFAVFYLVAIVVSYTLIWPSGKHLHTANSTRNA